jgi:hypothetical protein
MALTTDLHHLVIGRVSLAMQTGPAQTTQPRWRCTCHLQTLLHSPTTRSACWLELTPINCYAGPSWLLLSTITSTI